MTQIGENSSASNERTGKNTNPARLFVKVVYMPDRKIIRDAAVSLGGPMQRSGKTDRNGWIIFENLKPGAYQVQAKYETTNAVALAARANITSALWAYGANKPPYGRNTNKCNLFVYDMLSDGGIPPALNRHDRKVFGITVDTVYYPPLARDWASGNVTGWSATNDAEPGDVIAEAHQYWDATGHCGIVSFPRAADATISLPEGKTDMILELQRQTVSATGTTIVENDWGFRASQKAVFMHHN